MDDVLISGTFEAHIQEVKKFLHNKFTIKDMGHVHYFLGIEVSISNIRTFLSQRKYIYDTLLDACLVEAKPAPILFSKGRKLSTSEGTLPHDLEKYGRLIGRLLFLGLTRADIT